MSVGTWLRRKAKTGGNERAEPSVWSAEPGAPEGDGRAEPRFDESSVQEVSPAQEDFWFDEAVLRDDPARAADGDSPATGEGRVEPEFQGEGDYQPVAADWAGPAGEEEWNDDELEWIGEEEEPRRGRGRILAAAVVLLGVTAGGAYAVLTMSGDEEPVAAAIEETEETASAADDEADTETAGTADEPLPGSARHAFQAPTEEDDEAGANAAGEETGNSDVRVITPADDIAGNADAGEAQSLTTGSVEEFSQAQTAEPREQPEANPSGVDDELAGGTETARFVVPPPLEGGAGETAADDPWGIVGSEEDPAMTGGGQGMAQDNAGQFGGNAASAGAARVTSYVNMRAEPDNNAAVVSVLSEGASVEVFGCEGWCEVNAGGQRGYVYESFLDRPQTSPQPGSTM